MRLITKEEQLRLQGLYTERNIKLIAAQYWVSIFDTKPKRVFTKLRGIRWTTHVVYSEGYLSSPGTGWEDRLGLGRSACYTGRGLIDVVQVSLNKDIWGGPKCLGQDV